MHNRMHHVYAPPPAGVLSMTQFSWSCWTRPLASPSCTYRSSPAHQHRPPGRLLRRCSGRSSRGNSSSRWTQAVLQKVWRLSHKQTSGSERWIFPETRMNTSCWASPRVWWWRPWEESWCSLRTLTPTSCRPHTGEQRCLRMSLCVLEIMTNILFQYLNIACLICDQEYPQKLRQRRTRESGTWSGTSWDWCATVVFTVMIRRSSLVGWKHLRYLLTFLDILFPCLTSATNYYDNIYNKCKMHVSSLARGKEILKHWVDGTVDFISLNRHNYVHLTTQRNKNNFTGWI